MDYAGIFVNVYVNLSDKGYSHLRSVRPEPDLTLTRLHVPREKDTVLLDIDGKGDKPYIVERVVWIDRLSKVELHLWDLARI